MHLILIWNWNTLYGECMPSPFDFNVVAGTRPNRSLEILYFMRLLMWFDYCGLWVPPNGAQQSPINEKSTLPYVADNTF